jgi:ParB family chromosome partitioning protein
MATRNHEQEHEQEQEPAQEHLAKQVGAGHGGNDDKNDTQETTTMNTETTQINDTLRMIPLSQLVRSSLNVRKSGSGDVSELAASIKANGVIQNLVVIPEKKGKRDVLGVVAGGRRLAALAQLVKAGDLDAETLIPCREVTKAEAVEMSTAENVVRVAMHPADEFEAYAAMLGKRGKTVEEVATRFGVSARHVEQRMKMANLSPKVIEAYRAGKLTLAAVMAYTLSDDHGRQELLLKQGNMSDWSIRRALTEQCVEAGDRRVTFVGEAAYTFAGGVIRADLFSESRYFDNVELLDRLTAEKLERMAVKLRKEFSWVDVEPSGDYETRNRYCAIPTVTRELSAEEAEKLAAMQANVEALNEAADSDDGEEDAWDRANDAAEELQEFEASLKVPHPDAAELAGAVVMLGYTGKAETLRNVIRKADRALLDKKPTDGVEGGTAAPEAEGDPNAVRLDLSGYATAVTQNELAKNVPVALRVLAYQLAHSLFVRSYSTTTVEIAARRCYTLKDSETLKASPLAAELDARAERWESTLPGNDSDLLAWCMAADDATIYELLAYATATSIDGVQSNNGNRDLSPILNAAGVQMVDHWKPNALYFSRIKKATTLRILAEHGHTAPELAKMKRDALAERAASLLQGTGWLAPSLR